MFDLVTLFVSACDGCVAVSLLELTLLATVYGCVSLLVVLL